MFVFLFWCRADSNRDGFLTENELANYINQAVKDHLANAMKYNYQRYSELDNDPRNGRMNSLLQHNIWIGSVE